MKPPWIGADPQPRPTTLLGRTQHYRRRGERERRIMALQARYAAYLDRMYFEHPEVLRVPLAFRDPTTLRCRRALALLLLMDTPQGAPPVSGPEIAAVLRGRTTAHATVHGLVMSALADADVMEMVRRYAKYPERFADKAA